MWLYWKLNEVKDKQSLSALTVMTLQMKNLSLIDY